MNEGRKPSQPISLDKHHVLDAFDCGVPALNDYLKIHAFQNIVLAARVLM